MLLYLFLGLLLMLFVVGLMTAFTRADPAALARALRWAAMGLAGAGIVLLPFVGRGSLVALGPAVLLPLFIRWLQGRPTFGPRPQPRTGQRSSVETAWLVMTLDHDTGSMEGEVRAGRFAGRALSTMSRRELLDLLEECRSADPESVPLLEAYLDRVCGPEWREEEDQRAEERSGDQTGQNGNATARGGMTREEAYEILGLEPGAGPDAIKEAHRRLMQKLHPDHGGSTYLAAKINQAKDLLLRN